MRRVLHTMTDEELQALRLKAMEDTIDNIMDTLDNVLAILGILLRRQG